MDANLFFRQSSIDDEGFLLERRAAVVVTMDAKDSFCFSPILSQALRLLADQIDAEHAANEAAETHVLQIDNAGFAFPVTVDVVSLDGLEWAEGDGPDVDVDPLEASRLLTPAELAAIA